MPRPYYTIIIPVTMSAKKGDAQPFFIGIRECVPAPSIAGTWGREWQGLDTLNLSTYSNAEGVRLPGNYTGSLLWRGEGLAHNNTDRAGWRFEEVGGKQVIRPSPTFRGNPVGEVSLTHSPQQAAHARMQGWTHPPVAVNSEYSTPAVREWLADNLAAPFLEAIRANREVLRSAAIAELSEHFRDGVERLRADAVTREAEAADILARVQALPIPTV